MALDSILEAIETKLDREINLFNVEFEKILRDIERELTIGAIEGLKDPLKFDYAFQQILKDTGYYDLINRFIDESYDKTYAEIIALYKEGGFTVAFSADDIQDLQNLKNLDIKAFRDIGSQAAERLRADLYKYSISDMTKATMVENIQNSLKDTDLAKYSNTYAETAISNYNQATIDLKAQDTDKGVWIYTGVRDKKTRKFCRCLLDQKKYYNDNDKSKIQNDKRRQWNCRHIMLKVSEEYAIDRGYKKGTATC